MRRMMMRRTMLRMVSSIIQCNISRRTKECLHREPGYKKLELGAQLMDTNEQSGICNSPAKFAMLTNCQMSVEHITLTGCLRR